MFAQPTVIAIVVWALVFGASLAGMWIGSRLPPEHRTTESQNVVTISMTMVSTLTALVLGLLLSVANTSFTTNQQQLMSTSSDLIRLEHLFRFYGSEADAAREALKGYAHSMMQDMFPPAGAERNVENERTLDYMARAENTAASLVPANATQRWLQPRMQEVADEIVQEHFALVRQRLDVIPPAVMLLLMVWLVLLFASYGLFAPRHMTSVIVLLLASGAASGAILLIIELETPNRGFVSLSPEPLQHAIDVMEKHARAG